MITRARGAATGNGVAIEAPAEASAGVIVIARGGNEERRQQTRRARAARR